MPLCICGARWDGFVGGLWLRKNLFSVYNIFQVQIMKVYMWMLYILSYYSGENQTLCLKTGTLWEKFGGRCVQKTPDGSRHPNNTQIWSGVLLKYLDSWSLFPSPYLAWFISCKSYNSVEPKVLNQTVYMTPAWCVCKDGRHALWKSEIIEFHQGFRKTLQMDTIVLDCIQLFFHLAVFQII